MEKERFMVIDNEKGVVIPLQSEKNMPLDRLCETKTELSRDKDLEDKVDRVHALVKVFVRQSIRDTIKEYHLQLTEELKEYEKSETKRWERLEEIEHRRWDKLEEEDRKRWDKLESGMEKHFKSLDQNIRMKQEEGKRKKHSNF